MTDESDLRRRYESVYGSLSRVELQKGSEGLEELGFEDLFGRHDDLWLGFYTHEGLRLGLERYGLFEDLKSIGFEDVELELKMDDPDEHLLRIWTKSPHVETAPLIELVVRRSSLRPTGPLANSFSTQFLNVLHIEWLQMQNPLGQFSPSRPPLPGQTHPGLGLGLQVLLLLGHACQRLNLDGLATVPAYFHNAVFYGEAFNYFDPRTQGVYLAATRDILPQAFGTVPAASWAIVWQMVAEEVDGEDQIFEWIHDVQVAPMSERLEAYFQEDAYNGEVQAVLTSKKYRVFRNALRETLASKGLLPFDSEKLVAWVETRDDLP